MIFYMTNLGRRRGSGVIDRHCMRNSDEMYSGNPPSSGFNSAVDLLNPGFNRSTAEFIRGQLLIIGG